MDLNQQIIESIKIKGALTAAQVISATGRPRSSVFKGLTELVKSSQLIKGGAHPQITYHINIAKPIEEFSKDLSVQGSSLQPMTGRVSTYPTIEPLQKVVIILIVLISALLSYHIYHYVSSVSEFNRLHLQMTDQAEEMQQTKTELLNSREELILKEAQIVQITQERGQLSLQLNEYKDNLTSTRQQIVDLQGQFKGLADQLQDSKKQAAKSIEERELINTQLKEQIKTINQIIDQQNKKLQDYAAELFVFKQAQEAPSVPVQK